ncbi:MAG: hypothetical protein ACSHYB_13015 [Roseibacillus sp.]
MNSRRDFILMGSAAAAALALPLRADLSNFSSQLNISHLRSFSVLRETNSALHAKVSLLDFQSFLAKGHQLSPSRVKADGNQLTFEEAGKQVTLSLFS